MELKTTICEMLEQLGYQFVKPLHYLFDKIGQINEYQTITKVNKSCNRHLLLGITD